MILRIIIFKVKVKLYIIIYYQKPYNYIYSICLSSFILLWHLRCLLQLSRNALGLLQGKYTPLWQVRLLLWYYFSPGKSCSCDIAYDTYRLLKSLSAEKINNLLHIHLLTWCVNKFYQNSTWSFGTFKEYER